MCVQLFNVRTVVINYDYIDREWLVGGDGRECYNYATINGNLYRWKSVVHKNKGDILRRYHGDTTSLLTYFIDWSGIKSSTYSAYLTWNDRVPENVEVIRRDDMLEIREYSRVGSDSNAPMDTDNKGQIVTSTLIREKPPWLFALRNASSKGLMVLEFDCPKVIKKLPKSVLKLPGNIKFKNSRRTVDVDMLYL